MVIDLLADSPLPPGASDACRFETEQLAPSNATINSMNTEVAPPPILPQWNDGAANKGTETASVSDGQLFLCKRSHSSHDRNELALR
jgi:hypothetical protein